MAAPFAFQVRQFSHKFKADFFMALAAGGKGLPSNQSHFMGQAMSRVNHTINSAFGNDG